MEEESLIRRKAFVVGILLTIFSSYLSAFHAMSGGGAFGWSECQNWYWGNANSAFVAFLGWPFLISIIIAVVNAIKPIFTRAEVAIVLVMTIIGTMIFNVFDIATTNFGMSAAAWYYSQATPEKVVSLWELMPDVFGPKDLDLMSNIIPRSVLAVNLGAWGVALLWGILFTLSPLLLFFFISLFYRKLYIDQIALPFPMATV